MRDAGRMGRAAAAAAAAVLLCAATAGAQTHDSTRAQADALFREGQQLLTAGQVAAACGKLEQSEQLDPKIGRLLNVAYCHEKQGRIATAWHEYDQAAAMAVQAHQAEREKFARKHAAELAKKLAFLRLDVGSLPDGAQVSIDDKPLAHDQWPVPFAVDPGDHTITVAAPGYKTHMQSVTIAGTGETRVAVGALEKEEAPPAPATPAPEPAPAPAPVAQPEPQPAAAVAEEPPPSHGSSRTLGWIVGGAGVVALGVGAGFGFDALSLKSQADGHCPNRQCDATGLSDISSAKTAATVSTIGLAVGVVGVGVGAFFLLRPSSSPSAASAAVTPFVGADRAGVALQGAW
ncbi:MAG TPA: PEGA domain-containing protein [Polyangiaceae bacterium]